MQMSVATPTNVIIIDKLELNPLHDSSDKPVWGAIYSVVSDTARALHIATNSFCASGTWLSNGTCERHFPIHVWNRSIADHKQRVYGAIQKAHARFAPQWSTLVGTPLSLAPTQLPQMA